MSKKTEDKVKNVIRETECVKRNTHRNLRIEISADWISGMRTRRGLVHWKINQ